MKAFDLPDLNATLRYLDLPGAGPPLVFIHGLGCAGSYDYPIVAADPVLAGCRKIIVDLLGNGYSDRPADFSYTVEAQAAVLARLLESLDLEGVYLYGHSAGGAVAMQVVRLVADRIKGVVLSEANLEPSPPRAFSFQIASDSEADFVSHGLDRLLKRLKRISPGWLPTFSTALPAGLWRFSASLKAGSTPTGRELFYAFSGTKAYIIGARTRDPDRREMPAHGIPVHIVSNAGHAMAWENPAGLAAAIARSIET